MDQLSHPARLMAKAGGLNPAVREGFVAVLLLIADIVAVAAALQAAWASSAWLTPESAGPSPLRLEFNNTPLMIMAIYLAILCSEGLYRDFTPFLLGAKKLVKVTLY